MDQPATPATCSIKPTFSIFRAEKHSDKRIALKALVIVFRLLSQMGALERKGDGTGDGQLRRIHLQ